MSMAHAYRMKKKMADGGYMEGEESQPAPVAASNNKAAEMTKSMRSAFNYDKDYAHGGPVCMDCGGQMMAEGGELSQEPDMDMIDHIMNDRSNGADADASLPEADFEPAEFDDLVKDDGLEEHYTGKNSGDEIGDKEQDEERSLADDAFEEMKKKKDKNPKPA